jgi:hypothetical protein
MDNTETKILTGGGAFALHVPDVPNVPNVPEVPNVPLVPNVPEVPTVRGRLGHTLRVSVSKCMVKPPRTKKV